jgi:threonine synthase
LPPGYEIAQKSVITYFGFPVFSAILLPLLSFFSSYFMNTTEKYLLRCPVCAVTYAPSEKAFTCAKCRAPTIVAMNLDTIPGLVPTKESSMWRYFDLLPLEERKWIVSQGEGRTPLTTVPRLAKSLDVESLALKNETMNPTGSFKDRQISLSISKARETGETALAVISSGNVAAAAASYAALAGMRCSIFAPGNAPEEKLLQARMYGASFFKVKTLSSSRIFKLVDAIRKKKNWHLLSTAGLYNPHQVEGAKTIAYELVEQISPLPDWIIAPVGGGGLIGALWRGFEELRLLGRCGRSPAIVGVQSAACTPLVNAINKDLNPGDVIANPVNVSDTIAGAIADDILFDAYTALPAIRLTGGRALSVTDEEMLAAEKMLAETTGIFAEPASASTIAALKKLVASGTIQSCHRVCCIITGSGFKDMASAKKLVGEYSEIEPTEEAFEELD